MKAVLSTVTEQEAGITRLEYTALLSSTSDNLTRIHCASSAQQAGTQRTKTILRSLAEDPGWAMFCAGSPGS